MNKFSFDILKINIFSFFSLHFSNNLININKTTSASIPPIPPSPLISTDLNRQLSSSHLNHYCSPKFQIMSFSNKSSPLVHTNKENKSPFVKGNTPTPSKISTSEIINAANRMLVKRESNNNLNRLGQSATATTSTTTCSETATACSFKDIKKKFENLSNQAQQHQPSIPMTPKSIIKKFEELSTQTNYCMPPRSTSNSTTNLSNSAPPNTSNINNNNNNNKRLLF